MLIGFGKDWRSKLVLLILTRQLKNGGGGGWGGGVLWLGKRDDQISITVIRGQEPIDFPKEGEAERVKSLAKIC